MNREMLPDFLCCVYMYARFMLMCARSPFTPITPINATQIRVTVSGSAGVTTDSHTPTDVSPSFIFSLIIRGKYLSDRNIPGVLGSDVL